MKGCRRIERKFQKGFVIKAGELSFAGVPG
jgi:hypothetical protein